MLLAAAHLHWSDLAFQLDDAWPAPQDLPIYVRVYANPTADADPLPDLHITPPLHADVDKMRRIRIADGRLEILGIQFRSATARRRWQEAEEQSRSHGGNGRHWSYRRAGGASIILVLDEGEKSDQNTRLALQKALDAAIGSAIDRQWNRPRDVVQRVE
jgi:hypothetical protein